MDHLTSPILGSRSPSQPRSPWSSLVSPTPNKTRFPGMVLANLIRHKPAPSSHTHTPLSPCLGHPSTPNSTPGEDFNNFVWDAESPSGSPRRPNDEEELFEIARLYQPSIVKRTRPAPQPILTRRELLPLTAVSSEGPLTPALPSGGAFKSSIHRLLRKRTALHLKNSSQSSSSTASPSENSADAEDQMGRELDEASDDDSRGGLDSHLGSPYMLDEAYSGGFYGQPVTPSPQTPAAYPFPHAFNSPVSTHPPVSAHRSPLRGRHVYGTAEDEHCPTNQLPPRSSSIGQ